MKCPNCRREMKKDDSATTGASAIIYSCLGCKMQIAAPEPSKRPDSKVTEAWEKGWGSFG